jgi:ribose 5-phosphate isomerase A
MSSESHTPRLAAKRALDWIRDGQVVGLGTGRAAMAFLQELGSYVQSQKMNIRCVASSRSTADQAARLGLPLVGLDEITSVDITVDGADEIDPQRNAIKGLGGALLREKVVACSSKQWILCIGAEKRVERLGMRGILPVEVVPFALPLCVRRLAALGFPGEVRSSGGDRFVTDNGNYILDCRIARLENPHAAEAALLSVPGVVETGLFLGMSPLVITQDGTRVELEGA